MPVLVLIFAACAPPSEVAPASPAATTAPDVDAEWSLEDLVAAVLDMTALPILSPHEVRDTYLALMAAGDAVCPGSTTQLTGTDLRGCTAETGYFYAGIGTWFEQTGSPPSWRLGGDFEIIDAEGHRFIGGGLVGWGQSGEGVETSEYQGQWSYPGGTDAWLGTGISAYLAEVVTPAGVLTLDGGLTYGAVSVWAEALSYDPATCEGLTGGLQVRDPSGLWFTLSFGDDCDNIAVLGLDGEDLGALELDLTAWMEALLDHAGEG